MSGPCASGCRILGQHLADCVGRQADGNPCTGCLPRPATEGTLCAWCYGRLTRAVADIPATITHLHLTAASSISASAKPLSDDPHTHGDPAWTTVLPTAWIDADELDSIIDSWAHVVIDEHHAQPMRGPNASPWNGNVVGWITPHLEWIATRDWAFEMVRDLAEHVATLRHKYPSADDVEPARTIDVPCPRCGLMSMIYTPPRYARQAFRVECTDPDCARVFSEDEWDRLKALALDQRRMSA